MLMSSGEAVDKMWKGGGGKVSKIDGWGNIAVPPGVFHILSRE